MIFFKKQKSVFKKIEEYLDEVDICMERFIKCSIAQINTEEPEKYNDMVENVHKAESNADDIRRDIEYELYQKALIPESRGDLLGILETLDKIPNMFEFICYQFLLQKVVVPEDFRNDFTELVKLNLKSYELLKGAVKAFLNDCKKIDELRKIDDIESKSDRMEKNIVMKIFNSNLEKADMLILKEIAIDIGDISDRAQVVADRIALTIIKRRI